MIGRVAVGHPVDVASGAFFDDFVDVVLHGLVPSLARRWYNTGWAEQPVAVPAAQEPPDLPFGVGWRASWQYELRKTVDGYKFEAPDGTAVSFLEPEAQWVRSLISPGDALELSRRPDGNFQIVSFGFERSPVALLFSPASDGGFEFYAEERTEQARVIIERDQWHRVSAMVQRRERRAILIEYSSEGRVARLSARYPDGSVRAMKQFEYDYSGRLIAVHDADGVFEQYAYDANNRMIELRNRRGSIYTMRYDSRGRCYYVSGSGRHQERTLIFDTHGQCTLVRDSHGATTKYELNPEGQCVAMTMPSGAMTRYEFDREGRIVSCANEWQALSSVEYDAVGRVSCIHRADGSMKRLKHDDLHRLIEYVAPDGKVYRFEPGPNHQPARAWFPGTSAPWVFDSNEWGELVRVTDPRGASRSNGYDDRGNVTWTTDWNGHAHQFEFDVRADITAHIDPLKQRTEYMRDGRDNLVAIRFPDGRLHQRAINLATTEIVYTLPDGRRSVTRMDPCGKVTENIDEDGYATRYVWDTEPARLLQVTNHRGDTTEFRYDGDGRVIEMKTFDGRVFRYEWKGPLLVNLVLPDGRRIENEFDMFGRVAKQTRPDGKTEYGYTLNHQLTSVETTTGTSVVNLAFGYDDAGGCVTENQQGIDILRSFDARLNLRSFATSLGDKTEIEVDGNGDFTLLKRGGAELTVMRDALGREVHRKLTGGASVTHWWDPVGRMTAQRLSDSSGKAVMERSFGYDRAGELAGLRDSLRGDFAFAYDGRSNLLGVLRPTREAEIYSYGATGNRLGNCVIGQGGAQIFEQVRAGAGGSDPLTQLRLDLRGTTRNYQFAAGDRLLDASSSAQRVLYEHDALGRVIRRTRVTPQGSTSHTFEWDSLDCLRRVALPDGRVWTYDYDGLCRRISKTAPDGGTTRYVWDQLRIAYEVAPSGKTVAWIYADDGGPLLMDDGTVHLVVADQVGAPMEVASSKGDLEDVVSKGTWGENFKANFVRQPFLGQWFDDETGLHYNVFRYYDPETGQYLTPDPIGLLGGHNLYAWVGSPTGEVDPWGLYTEYEDLRKKTPSTAVYNHLKENDTTTCPVYGKKKGGPVDADHIVPLRTIWDKPGFQGLTDAQQEAIANMKGNFRNIGQSANRSRQDRSWADWEKADGHSKKGTGNQAFMEEMKKLEIELHAHIDKEIAKAKKNKNYVPKDKDC